MRPCPLLLVVAQLAAGATVAMAQRVPGGDLLRFPLGHLDRAAALESAVGDGLGNPAAIALDSGERARAGAAALQTPAEQGVRGALITGAFALPSELTIGVTAARLWVDDLARTETDPQTVGDPIPYGTTLFSMGVARRTGRRIVSGIALRYRHGELDERRAGAFGVDAGVIARNLPFRDASVGAASFLWHPGGADGDPVTLNLATDLRVLGTGEAKQLRAGYAFSATGSQLREHTGTATGRWGMWEGRVGLGRADAYGAWEPWRTRLGILVHYAPYVVGVAREENGAGLSAIYQFSLKATLR